MSSPTSYVFKSTDDGKTEHINPSIAYVGNGKEVHGADEYDPFGTSVYYTGGLRNEDCHLEQALAHMPVEHKAKYKEMCIEADKWANVPNASWNRTIAYATCHEYLMKCVKKYWADAEERIEGESRE